MQLEYTGQLNHRNRVVWIDKEYYDEKRPFEGFEMEEWQIPRYRELVETAESCMGRKLTKAEARTMNGLSAGEEIACKNIVKFIRESYRYGQRGGLGE